MEGVHTSEWIDPNVCCPRKTAAAIVNAGEKSGHVYKHRNRIERCFSRLKHFCRFATRYDRRTPTSPARQEPT